MKLFTTLPRTIIVLFAALSVAAVGVNTAYATPVVDVPAIVGSTTFSLVEFATDNDFEGWVVGGNNHIINSAVCGGTLQGTTAGNDPVISSPDLTPLNISTSLFDQLEIRILFDELSTSRLEIFWTSSTFPAIAGGGLQSVQETAAIIRDGSLHTYRFDMSGEVRWTGSLQSLRIDPLADSDAQAGRSFAIDYVRLRGPAPVPEPATLALLAFGLAGIGFSRRKAK